MLTLDGLPVIDVSWVEVMVLRKREALLKRRCRSISGAIEKAGEDFIKTLKAREKVTDKVEELERSLIKITVIKGRKTIAKKTSISDATTIKAIELAMSGDVAAAWALMKSGM
jgi:hypothetical protein